MTELAPPRQPDWRLQLGVILLVALALRIIFFTGFGLGDDWGYVNCARDITEGSYPSLDPMDQYAYRPLLLLLFAGGITLFGCNDVGVVAPVILASLAMVGLVYYFVRRLIDPRAAWWCALLFACEPANIVDSTTMTNDVILALFIFAAIGTFLLADRETELWKSLRTFILAGFFMILAFLIKISIIPALGLVALYSLTTLVRGRWRALGRQLAFHFSFVFFLCLVCLAYRWKTGDFLWQFKSELHYYKTNPAYSTANGPLDYAELMREYPIGLFLPGGYTGFSYFAHGWLFWLFVPAGIWGLRPKGDAVVKFWIGAAVLIFLFFEFYPSDFHQAYIPLPRQLRYLEMLLPGVVIAVGVMFCRLAVRWPRSTRLLLALTLGHFVIQAAYCWTQYDDSQRDMRDLAHYAGPVMAATKRHLVVDEPGSFSVSFYLVDDPAVGLVTDLESIGELRDCYVAVGGARSFWWDPGITFDPVVPADWVLVHEVSRPARPWRSSNLRVYYVAGPVKKAALQSKLR